jgi:hypothetical protein
MEDEIKKVYESLSSEGRVTVGYDDFAKAYNSNADYRAKIDAAAGLKKKEPSEVSPSKPSAKPSASATSPSGIPPVQRQEPIQPTFTAQAPNVFGGGRPVAPRPLPTKAADQLSPEAKAQVQQRVAKGQVQEAPAEKPSAAPKPSAPGPSSYLSVVEKEEFERANRVREAVAAAESKLKEKNVDQSLAESFDLGFNPGAPVKTEDSEEVQAARKNANDAIKQTLNVDFDIYVPNEEGVLVEDTKRVDVVKKYLDNASQYEQYANAQNTIDEARKRQQEDPNAFPLTSQLLNSVPESIGLATAFAFDAVGAGDTKAYSDEVRAKRAARRVALGIEDGKGITENISEGNIGDAMKELMLAGADFVPQMAAFVVNPAVGYAYNAASAGGSTYDQFRDRNDLSKGDKMTLALISSAADFALNKLTMGAENSIRAALGITAEELGTQVAKKKALDYLNPLKSEIIKKGVLGEAAEEGGVNLINQIAASVIAGDDFDINSLIDETLIGGVFGGTAVGVPKVLARGANGLANASMVSEFRKVTDEIKQINDALLNEELTPAESALLTRNLEQLSARQNEISNASEQLYAAMTKEDQDALYEAHRQINENLKTYNESENKVVKNAAFKQVRDALIAKRDLENKYVGQVKTEEDDSEKEAGVPSPVVEGEAVVEAQPVEGAGQEAPEAGGVLQVPVEEGAEVTAPIEATVFAAPFYDTKVNNIEEARTIRQSEPYVQNLDTIRNASALFNVEIDNVDESIGGFVNDAGDKIVEVSNIIRVKGTPEDIENYAAFLATSAPETQEATIAATYVEPDSDAHNIDELTISVSDIDGAIESLKENDIYDFTINDSNNTITFLDFSKGADDAFVEKIGNFTNSLDSRNISYEQQDIRAIDSKYIGPEERSGILGRLQEALVQQGQTGSELYQQVQQAIERNNEFLAKTQEVVGEEVETLIEPARDAEAAKAVKPASGKSLDDVYKSYKESIKPRIDPKTILEGAKKQLIDRQSKIKNAVLELGLRNAYDRIVNKSGASARANDKYRRAEDKIYKGLSEKDIETLDKIIFARRVIQIDQNFDQRGQQRPKHPLGYKSENANFELAELKNKLGEEKYNDLIKRSDAYFEEFRSTLKDLYDAGLVSEEMYNDLRTNNYQPRKFIEHVYDFENSEFLIRDSGLSQQQIKAIKEGSEKDLIMSSRFLLGSYLLSASKRIFTNRTNKAVAEAIGKEGANDWVRSLDEKADPDAGFSKVYYFEDGVQQQFQLRSDLKKELDNVSSLAGTDGKVGRFFSIISGTPVIKLMATRANPLFAFKNFPRDLGHILFFTNVYDKHNLYYATYLVFGDFIKGLKSSIQDTQDFRDYMDLGGGMDFISIQGRDGNFVSRSAINKTVEGIGKLGEWSEVGFRIGVYKRFKDDGIAEFEKKNGVKPEGEDLLQIKERAVAKAREIIDFSQGGEAVKAADKFVPYLNAAFQGFRVGTTYVSNNHKKFASKFVQAQMGILALSFFNALIGDDEDMEAIPEHTRLMNFVIMLPWTRVDEDGKKRRAYIQIPKTQQAAPFFALMDVANRKIINDVFGKEYSISKDEYTYIVNGIRKGLPIGDDSPMKEIQSLIPVINAATTYSSNYDSFRDRMITMDKDKVLPAYEGVNDPNVEQFYKVIGEVTGMSPIRGKVATEKLITGPNSSFIIGMSYGLLDAVAKQYPLDKGDYNLELAEKEKKSFIKQTGLNMSRAFVRETDPDWKLYNQKETLENIDMEAGTERARLRKKAKELAMGTNTQENLDKAVVEAQKIIDDIAKKNPIDAMYFMDSFKANIGESPASQEAVEIQYSATDKARAQKIKYLYNPQTKEDFTNLMKEVYQQTGYKVSPRTIYEYQTLYGQLK